MAAVTRKARRRISSPQANVQSAFIDYLYETRQRGEWLAYDWFDSIARFETVAAWHIHMAECACLVDGTMKEQVHIEGWKPVSFTVTTAEAYLRDAGHWQLAFAELFEDQFSIESLIEEFGISDRHDEILFQWACGFIEGLQAWWTYYAKQVGKQCRAKASGGAVARQILAAVA